MEKGGNFPFYITVIHSTGFSAIAVLAGGKYRIVIVFAVAIRKPTRKLDLVTWSREAFLLKLFKKSTANLGLAAWGLKVVRS